MELSTKLENMLKPILAAEEAELVAMEIKGSPGNQVVRVFVDTADGITLSKCEAISRQLSDRLDIEDLIPGKYRLEVSSPGLNRPLRSFADFNRNLNRNVEITYSGARGEQTVEGKIVKVSPEMVTIESKQEIKEIAMASIKFAKVALPW